MEDKLSKIKCLDGFTLKLIAMITMAIDHTGAILFPEHIWLRIIGRLAFPIFAYMVAEGFYYTHNKNRYLLRMGIFACVTEPFFDLAFYGRLGFTHQNVCLTFFIAIAGLYAIYMVQQKVNNIVAVKLISCVIIVIFALVAQFLRTDYGSFGVMLVYVYYMLRDNYLEKHIFSTVLQIVCATGIQRYSALSTIPLMLYNGKRGRGLKYMFYVFYPAHLFVLYLISQFI